jgi:hypothetical protein
MAATGRRPRSLAPAGLAQLAYVRKYAIGMKMMATTAMPTFASVTRARFEAPTVSGTLV